MSQERKFSKESGTPKKVAQVLVTWASEARKKPLFEVPMGLTAMSQQRIYDQELFAHFVTFSCYHRRRLLALDQPKRILLGVLNEQLEKQSATCAGFVVMPNHVHAIVWFPEVGQLSRFLHGWKRRSSFHIREWFKANPLNYSSDVDLDTPTWQRKYYSFEIETQQKLEEKLQYMQLNPVRAGLVEKTTDWKWSSARWYELQRTVGVELGWVE